MPRAEGAPSHCVVGEVRGGAGARPATGSGANAHSPWPCDSWSHDDKLVASGSRDATVKLWRCREGDNADGARVIRLEQVRTLPTAAAQRAPSLTARD